MKRYLYIITFGFFLLGCAGTSLNVQQVFKPPVNAIYHVNLKPLRDMKTEAVDIMLTRISTRLGKSMASSPDKANYQMDIAVQTYNVRHGATRALFGIMAGVDRIISEVRIIDKKTGMTVGKYTVNSLNDSAWGTSQSLIEQHIDEIMAYINKGAPKEDSEF